MSVHGMQMSVLDRGELLQDLRECGGLPNGAFCVCFDLRPFVIGVVFPGVSPFDFAVEPACYDVDHCQYQYQSELG